MKMVSNDGMWSVSVVSLDGRQVFRIASRRAATMIDPETSAECMVRLTDGWYLMGHVTEVADIERWVPLAELS